MLLILEIWLTKRAWQKGWNGYALVPLLAGILFVVFVGAAAGPDNIAPIAFATDVVVSIVLAIMARRGRESVSESADSVSLSKAA